MHTTRVNKKMSFTTCVWTYGTVLGMTVGGEGGTGGAFMGEEAATRGVCACTNVSILVCLFVCARCLGCVHVSVCSDCLCVCVCIYNTVVWFPLCIQI